MVLYIEDQAQNLELRYSHTAEFGIELAAGFTAYLTKPIDIANLYDALSKFIVKPAACPTHFPSDKCLCKSTSVH